MPVVAVAWTYTGRGRRDDKGRAALTWQPLLVDGESRRLSAIFFTLGGLQGPSTSPVEMTHGQIRQASDGRGERIRTSDPLVPEPATDVLNCCFV
jgi:hypothetical protein